MKFTTYNDDFGKNELGNLLEESASQKSALQSLLIAEDLNTEESHVIKDFKCVKEFLESPLNNEKEKAIKKLFTAATILANEKGVLPFNIDKSPVAIASTVDEGLTRLKVGYKTEIGELDPIEAADALIDRATSRTITVVDKAIEKGTPIIIDKVCTLLVKAYPPATAIVPVIKHAEKYITPAAKVAARKGIQLVANTAKKVVRTVANTAKTVANKIMNFLKA